MEKDEPWDAVVIGGGPGGDVVRGLNQLTVSEAEGAIAATAIHNRLPRNFREDDSDSSGPTTSPSPPHVALP